MNKNIMIIAAHPDDELLGVGGTIIKHCNNGDNVSVLILGTGITSRDSDYLSNDLKKLKAAAIKASQLIGYSITFQELPDNKFDSTALLNIVKIIEKYLEITKPDIVYTHNYSDLNIDHRLTFEAVMTAARPCFKFQISKICCFETVSSTEWQSPNLNSFKPNYFNKLSINVIEKKIDAIQFYNNTEMRTFPHPRSGENILNVARVRGSIVMAEFAEAFEIVRIIKE